MPTASPLDTSYVNTSGVTGTTHLDASQVQRAWERGIGTTEGVRNNNPTAIAEEASADLSASVAGGGRGTDPATGFYSGIPAPNVNLAGMTEEQRELVEYLQARVGQCSAGRECDSISSAAHNQSLFELSLRMLCMLCSRSSFFVFVLQMRSSVSASISFSDWTK